MMRVHLWTLWPAVSYVRTLDLPGLPPPGTLLFFSDWQPSSPLPEPPDMVYRVVGAAVPPAIRVGPLGREGTVTVERMEGAQWPTEDDPAAIWTLAGATPAH